jgi:DNA (cytosine-5)-methyltransferase 1
VAPRTAFPRFHLGLLSRSARNESLIFNPFGVDSFTPIPRFHLGLLSRSARNESFILSRSARYCVSTPLGLIALADIQKYQKIMMTKKSFSAVSLFACAGGCSLGFKKAGYDILYAIELEAAAVQTYQANFSETICHKADIRDFDFKKLLKQTHTQPGELDILIGGPPCQGFSAAGPRFWDDPRNALLKNYINALKILRPKWFLMENVEGLLTTKRGQYLYEVAKAFIELGYWIRIDKIYAHEYGIGQRRKRVFMIGNCLGYEFSLPKPLMPVHGAIFRHSNITLRHAIAGLPNATQDKDARLTYHEEAADSYEAQLRNQKGWVSDHYYPNLNSLQLKRIQALKPKQSMKDLPEELQHSSFARRANRRVKDGTPTDKRGGAPSGLKRLCFDEPCLTITSGATSELIHPVQDRPLTLRECARIQTFPDGFEFYGNATQKIQQIANAIPPLLAQLLAEHIKTHYGFEAFIARKPGKLIGFTLTKATAMSPALNQTQALLDQLSCSQTLKQLNLFN